MPTVLVGSPDATSRRPPPESTRKRRPVSPSTTTTRAPGGEAPPEDPAVGREEVAVVDGRPDLDGAGGEELELLRGCRRRPGVDQEPAQPVGGAAGAEPGDGGEVADEEGPVGGLRQREGEREGALRQEGHHHLAGLVELPPVAPG